MPWPHTKTLVVSDKHRKSKIANRKMFIFAQDKFLRFTTTSFLQKAQYELLIEMEKYSLAKHEVVKTLCLA